MSIVPIKAKLHNYIDQADERLLRSIYAMMQQYFQEEEAIIGFTTSGEPLTKVQLLTSVENAVKDVENGKGLSSKEIRKMKNTDT